MRFCKIVNTGYVEQSFGCREKPGKSKTSATLGQKGLCVSVSAEDTCGNGFTPGVRFLELLIYILAKGILFRKRETVKTYEYGTVKQNAGAWRFSMYQRFAADSAYRSSGILPVSLLTFFLGPTG